MAHSIHETIAVAISGAPFPTARSLGKARAVLSALSAAGLAVVPREGGPEQIRAMAESRAFDDEGRFEPLSDLLGFSGENKVRTVLRAAYQAAIEKAEAGDGSH